jgi:hypothetical protein
MRKLILILFLFAVAVVHAQVTDYFTTVDSTYILNRLNGPVRRGTLIKTSPVNFYEINDNVNHLLPSMQPMAVVYNTAGAYSIRIEGIDRLLACMKVKDVTESYINGEFKGWDGTTTFKLANLQEWQQSHTTPSIVTSLFHPAVFIYFTPEGYKMKIEGLNEEPILVKKVR